MIKNQEIFSSILGTVLLGAVGSGVWQYIVEPGISSSTNIILNIATLGVEEFKNDLYKEIAKDFHEEASNTILVMITLILSLFFIILPLYLIKKFKEDKESEKEEKNTFFNEINVIKEKEKFLTDSKEIEERLIKNYKKIYKIRNTLVNLSYSLFILLALLSTALFITSVRINYTNSAITYYKQLLSIASPNISNIEKLNYISTFSQVKSSSDYKNIINSIENSIDKDKNSIPEFNIW